MSCLCHKRLIKTKKSLIYERRGGPGGGWGEAVDLLWMSAMALISILFALVIAGAFAMIAYIIQHCIKKAIPEYVRSTRDLMIIITAEIFALGCGFCLYFSTYPSYFAMVNSSRLQSVMAEIILFSFLFGTSRYFVEKAKESKTSLVVPPIKTDPQKEPQAIKSNDAQAQSKVQIRPPRTSQKILLVVMISLILACVAYLIAL